MTEDELLMALSAVDEALESCAGWKEIKEIAGDYPLSLDADQLTTGQQVVMTFWRLFLVDAEGRSTAPDIQEASSWVILKSLEEFRRCFVEEVLVGGELDRDSIRSLFEATQATMTN